MGCKTSAIRSEGFLGTCAHGDRKESPSQPSSKLKPTRNTNQTSAGLTSEPTQQGNSGTCNSTQPSQRRSSRSSMPTSPRRSRLETTHNNDSASSSTSHQQQQPQSVSRVQGNNVLAPPQRFPLREARKSDSVLTVRAGSSSDDDVRVRAWRHEDHFDPIPIPKMAQVDSQTTAAAADKDRTPPRLPSAEPRPVRKDNTVTFRTSISDHDKTDSAQAAKEYQQRVEAKRTAEEVHTKRRRLEEFDPVRPVDSFNVTHRGLLGRCWDRRAPELIPISFVHIVAKALGVEESHLASTTTASHMSNGGDEFLPGSPTQHLSRLSYQSGVRSSIGSSPMPATFPSAWTGIGGRRVPRRSHWFSVGGISMEGFAPAVASSPIAVEPFYMSSAAFSPMMSRPSAAVGSSGLSANAAATTTNPAFSLPATSAAMVGGGVAMSNASLHFILNSRPSSSSPGSGNSGGGGGSKEGGWEAVKGSAKRSLASRTAVSSGELDASLDDSMQSFAARTLTPEQVMTLPWETREKYFNVMMSCNPRFMGIKDVFAFKLGSGVSNDRSVKFLRKRNLEPAPGVTAVRWNRVEFFHPSLHTLVCAVAKTQGMSIELRQIEQASLHAAEGVPASSSDVNLRETNFCANSSLNSRAQTGEPSSTGADSVSATAAAVAIDGIGSTSADVLHRSFSQLVMGQVENRSFSGTCSGQGGGGRSQINLSLNKNNNSNSNPLHVDKDSIAVSEHDRNSEHHHGLWAGGSFLMGFHRNHGKDVDGGSGGRDAAAPLHFPEDSVAALALGMPYSRLGELPGVPAVVRNAVLGSAGWLGGNLLYPSGIGLGSRRASRDTMHNVNSNTSTKVNGGNGGRSSSACSPPRGSGYAAWRPSSDSVLVSLCISSFSVSINPFKWQERRYTRCPVDIDGSKRSSRHNYGEGVVTDVMYGGIMVIECSSMTAAKELQSLLSSMTWTEERSLQGIVKDIRKHLKTVHTNLHKSRQATLKRMTGEKASNAAGGGSKTGAEAAATAKDWNPHRYRIIRRIGGRPMRDAVELEEIRVFFGGEEEEVREERTSLRQPDPCRKQPSALNESPTLVANTATGASIGAKSAGRLPSLGLDKPSTDVKPANLHSSPNGPDPDVTSSFSRVASAWFGLPVISVVLRTWGLHLLACPEYAQPTAMFLQKHAGLAPVLQLTALGSFYHEGNTPSDVGAAANEFDDLFFESDGPAYDEVRHANDAVTHHPQPTQRISNCNRFYASSPTSPTEVHADDDNARLPQNKDQHIRTVTSGDDVAAKGKAKYARKSSGSSKSKPGNRDAPTVVSSPSQMRGSNMALGEMAANNRNDKSNDHTQDANSSTEHGCLRVRDPAHYHDGDADSLAARSRIDETVEGEGGAHMADSQLSNSSPLGGGRQSTALMSSSDNPTPGKAASSKVSSADSGSVPPKKVTITRPSSPLSSGRVTMPHSRRNEDHRHCRHASSSVSSRSSSSSTSTSSFFASSSNTRHSTLVYQLNNTNNNSSSINSGAVTERPSECNSRLVQKTAASALSDGRNVNQSTTLASVSTAEGPTSEIPPKPAERAPPLTTVPSSYDGVLSSLHEVSSVTLQPNPGSPHLFVPAPMLSSTSTRDTYAFELVAMARTVGPGESIAVQEAQLQANPNKTAEASLSQDHVTEGSSSHLSLGRRGSNRALNPAAAEVLSSQSPSPNSQSRADITASDLNTITTTKSDSSPDRAVRKTAKRKNPKRQTTKDASADVETKHVSSLSPLAFSEAAVSAAVSTISQAGKKSNSTVIVKRHGCVNRAPRKTTVTVDAPEEATPSVVAVHNPPSLPVAPSATGARSATEAQMRPSGKSTETPGRTHAPDTPSGTAHSSANGFSSLSLTANPTTGSTAVSTAPQISQEEAEGLWFMTMLEVKARRQELTDLREARRSAEDHNQKQQDELRALNRIFLPHTHPQDLDCTLLYLKTALFEPDDIPHSRLFLQQLDWLPLLAAVWTSPANRIRSVEIAAELTWMDIPRLGVIAGLLYHHNASGPLEELIIRSDKLLGGPRYSPMSKDGEENATNTGGGGVGGFLAKVRRQNVKRDKSKNDTNTRNTSLDFVTELGRTSVGFGPGCPPFIITPEEARDTLWLLLCAIATNSTTANFRVVLKGIPTPETSGSGGNGSSGDGSPMHERTASGMLASFFSTHRRDEHSNEPLLLKPESMLLDSFVVQPTLHDDDNNNTNDAACQRNPSFFQALVPAVQVSESHQRHMHNNTFDEAGFISVSSGSIYLDGSGQRSGTAANSPDQQHSTNTSGQPSSLIIVTSSLGNVASQDSFGVEEASRGHASSLRYTSKRSLSTLMTVRTTNAPGHGSPPPQSPPTAAAATATLSSARPVTAAVPTHQHHVKRRPWVHDNVAVEERPFYEVLMHRCAPVEEVRVAASNNGDPSLMVSPCIPHYHHPYNATHNDARFYVSAERQDKLQQAVKRAVAIANGEVAPPPDANEGNAFYSSKAVLPSAKQAPQEQQQSSEYTRTPSPPPPPVQCPPPLLFCPSNMVFGLDSVEEETEVLLYEERQLRDRAPDIWRALRKSVKRYNQAQQDARHKAMKGAAKNASPPPQMRQITLEY